MSRNEAYEWLCEQLGMSREETHIGMFDETQCKQVVELCQSKKPGYSGLDFDSSATGTTELCPCDRSFEPKLPKMRLLHRRDETEQEFGNVNAHD